MEKLTKQELKGPDLFISTMTRISNTVEQNRKYLYLFFSIIAVGGLVWAAWGARKSQQESEAQEKLYTAQKALAEKKEATPLFNELINRYPRTQASVFASLELSKIYHDTKMYHEEIIILENAKKVARHGLVKALVLDRLGNAYEAQNDCNKAIGEWESIAQNKEMLFMHGRAFIKAGLCYEKLGQFDKAEQTYLKTQNLKDEQASQTAKKYLRLMKRSQS